MPMVQELLLAAAIFKLLDSIIGLIGRWKK
jgi:hypothetical protein